MSVQSVRPKAVNPTRVRSRIGVEIRDGSCGRRFGKPLEYPNKPVAGAIAVDRLIVQFVGQDQRQIFTENRLEVRLSDSGYIFDLDRQPGGYPLRSHS